MKKGFTLIELLAVIVILAIIALIATPIVINIIKDAKESSNLRSADFYLDAVEYTIADATLNKGGIKNGTYQITTDGNICKIALDSNGACPKTGNESNTLEVEVNGEVPTGGYIKIENGKIKDISINLNNRVVIKDEKGELKYEEESNVSDLLAMSFYLYTVLNKSSLTNGTYPIMEDGNICKIALDSNGTCPNTGEESNILEIEINGKKPTGGHITIENGKIKDISMELDNKIITKNDKGELIYQLENPICTLVENGDIGPEGISDGDKYQCKVKDNMETGFEDGYYFYVVSQEENGTTNLIMERNIYYDSTNDVGVVATSTKTGTVAWISDSTFGCGEDGSYCAYFSKGPVTAMNYLYNATKDWDNVPNIIINYADENIYYNTYKKGTNGYDGIETLNNITKIMDQSGKETASYSDLKARLPKYDEVHGEGKCLTYEENGKKGGSCPLYLVNYLNKSDNVTGEGLQNISGIFGYWTLSSVSGSSQNAWHVNAGGQMSYGSGSVLNGTGVSGNRNNGVRPVINLKL